MARAAASRQPSHDPRRDAGSPRASVRPRRARGVLTPLLAAQEWMRAGLRTPRMALLGRGTGGASLKVARPLGSHLEPQAAVWVDGQARSEARLGRSARLGDSHALPLRACSSSRWAGGFPRLRVRNSPWCSSCDDARLGWCCSKRCSCRAAALCAAKPPLLIGKASGAWGSTSRSRCARAT